MSTDEPTILPLASVELGARLARDIHDSDGQVLLTAGAVLTEAALEVLAAQGVANIAIELQRSGGECAAVSETPHRRLRHLFRHCDLVDVESPAHQLFDAVLELRQEYIR